MNYLYIFDFNLIHSLSIELSLTVINGLFIEKLILPVFTEYLSHVQPY